MRLVTRIKITCFFLCSLTSCPLLFGQDNNTEKNNLLRGFSIQFGVSDFIHLYGYQGALISAKVHFNPSHALRFGISGGYNLHQATENATIETNTTYQQTNNMVTNVCSLGLNIDYLFYPNPEGELKLFCGFGPNVNIGYNFGKLINRDKKFTLFDGRYICNWNVGVRCILGLEWFIVKNFSLIAEYGVCGSYGVSYGENRKINSNAYRTVKMHGYPQTESWNINPMSVKFGISIYF